MGARRVRPSVTGSTLGSVTSAPTTLSVEAIAFNPRNPRADYDDVGELAESIREMGILQPLGVVRYEIFLTHYPEHEHAIGPHEWVVINGNRRLAAALVVELAEVPVRGLDHLGRDRMLDEAVLVENIQRTALPPMREAEAIRILVERHGSQAKVAKRLGKTGGFVSQRLALLHLVPELREALRSGELRLEDARDLGRLPDAEQVSAWQDRRQRPAEPPAGQPPPAEDAPAATPTSVNAVKGSRRPQRTPRIDIGEPAVIAAQLREHLSPAALAELVRLLI